jgi:subtilisin
LRGSTSEKGAKKDSTSGEERLNYLFSANIMKKFLTTSGLAAAFLLASNASAEPINGEYIVQVKAGINPAAVAGNHGVNPNHVYTHALHGFAASLTPGQLNKLQNDPTVSHIAANNQVFALGKPAGGGGTPPPPPQVTPLGVTRIGAAPGATAFNGAGVGVAVVDTGLDFNHADLNVSTALGASFSAFGGSAQDNEGHGTHVGGIIAAKNNTQDVVGVASGATVFAVKVLDATGSGSDAQVIAGLNWVAANANSVTPPIHVVNMSLGRDASSDDSLMHTAVANLYNAGITVVVAAGNDATLEAKNQVPAGFKEVLAVASTTAKVGTSPSRYPTITADTASFFTSDGILDPTTGVGVTISAPGEDEEDVGNSGIINSIGILSLKLGGGTTRMSGTSMASPHVAGLAALLWQQALQSSVTVSPEQIRTRIRAGASLKGSAPIDSPTRTYTFDGQREGVASAPGALSAP